MNAYLIRTESTNLYTKGYLIVDKEVFRTLEPPWKNNQIDKSCVPRGAYNCVYLPRSASGKYKRVYHIQGVENRSGILIHNGNIVDHTLGCVLLGLKHGKIGRKAAVLNSRSAMAKLNRIMQQEPINLEVY